MSFFGDLFGRRSVKLSDASWGFADTSSSAGKTVTQGTALQLSTAWRCVRLRSRVQGGLPVQLYETQPDGGAKRAIGHWLDGLIHESPNAEQTPAEFWAGMYASIDLWGNAYARKVWFGDRIVALQPMRADGMHVFRKDGQRRYRYSAPDRRSAGADDNLTDADVFHLRGFSVGGDLGLSAISYGRHTLGLGLASEEAAGTAIGNGLQVSGFVELASETKVSGGQLTELTDLFGKFMGSKKNGKVMPLPGNAKFVPLRMSPVDVELLLSRKFGVEEICRWFDTPPILVGHSSEGQTMFGAGVGEVFLGWVTLDLDPSLTATEQAIRKQLLTPVERLRYFAKYNREALLQADSTKKAEYLIKLTGGGLMDRDEARGKLNLGKRPGGDKLTVPANLVNLEDLGKVPPKATAPAPGDAV